MKSRRGFKKKLRKLSREELKRQLLPRLRESDLRRKQPPLKPRD